MPDSYLHSHCGISCLCLFKVSECCFHVCSDKPGFGVWRLLSCFAKKSYHTHYHSIVVAGNCSFSLSSIFKCQVKPSHSMLHFMSQLWRSAFYDSHQATCAYMSLAFLQPQQKHVQFPFQTLVLDGCHALGGTPTCLIEVLLLLQLCGNCSTNHNDCWGEQRCSGPRCHSPFWSGLPWSQMHFNLLRMRSVLINANDQPTCIHCT